ncbi:hypothetical protein ACQFYA_03280 [Promicromonospora sp. Marseille-Q5078]
MALLDTLRRWFRRERQEPLERPRDLPPPREGGRPHEAPYAQGADNALGWRDGGGASGF